MAMLGLCVSAFAAEKADKAEKKEAVKEHLENHFKIYGFIRNYFTYDNRESVGGTADLFYWTPKDENWNYTQAEAKLLGVERQDLNAQNQFRFLSLTSRVGVDVSGYKIAGLEFGAKVEADFYAGLTGSTGTAQLRLRQAFLTMTAANLGRNNNQTSVLKVGQGWHPMAADMPDIYSLETGAPFGPFSRTPLVQEDYSIGKNFTATAALIWQMQYTSAGPVWNKDKGKYEAGSSADFMKYGMAPELYLGVTYKNGGFLGRVGYDFLSIKPRKVNELNVKAKERMNASMGFVYLQYKKDLFTAKAKTTLGQGGEHFGIMSGYVEYLDKDLKLQYDPMRSSSTWVSFSYGKKVVGSLFAGYTQNLGTAKEHDILNTYYNKSGFSNINRMFRIEPEVTYNIGKFQVGLEYMLTATQFGKNQNKHGLFTDDLHWVANHRVQAIVKFTF